MIIGIVGKVGSGKSCAVKYIVEKYGAVAFSCDEIAKEMTDGFKPDMNFESADFKNEHFQEKIRTEFHPKVFSRIFENIAEQTRTDNIDKCKDKKIFLIETALPNDDFMSRCDKIIFIDNSYDKKIALLNEHRNYSEDRVKTILALQEYYDKFYKKADYVIENNGTKEDLLKRVKEVMDEICVICK